MRASTPADYRPDIDGLRAIAVCAVVMFHAAPALLPSGFVGVDVFFVISGYLISSIILREMRDGVFSFAGFYARRILRIFPALLLVVAASWGTGWVLLLADEYAALGREIAAGMGFVANFLFWKEVGYFGADAETRPLLHLWSLGVEEQFYIVWPIALYAVRKRAGWVAALIVAGLSVSFFVNVSRVEEFRQEAFFLPHTRAWELLLGALLARVELRGRAAALSGNACSLLGAVLLGLAFVLIDHDKAFPGWWALLPTLGAFFLIAGGRDAWLNRRLLSLRPVVLVGKISYPFYLWHWPVLAFARNIGNGELSATGRAALVALALVLAWLTYAVLEKSVQRARLALKPGILARVPLLVSLSVSILAVGLLTHQRGGFVERFPEVVRGLADYKFDHDTAYRVSSCFLRPDQGEAEFLPECVDPGFAEAESNVFLWGDSHAAHYYPGLRSMAARPGLALAQFNAAGCPPVAGLVVQGRPKCAGVNEHVLQLIKRLRPRVVVMSAHWPKYEQTLDFSRLVETIAAIKAAGVGQVVVIGPVPNWRPALPKVLYDIYLKDEFHRIPTALRTDLNDSIATLDARLAQTLKEAGVAYFSPMQVLCDEGACLTRLGDKADELVAWDYGHLTTKASSHVMQAMVERHPLSRRED